MIADRLLEQSAILRVERGMDQQRAGYSLYACARTRKGCNAESLRPRPGRSKMSKKELEHALH